MRRGVAVRPVRRARPHVPGLPAHIATILGRDPHKTGRRACGARPARLGSRGPTSTCGNFELVNSASCARPACPDEPPAAWLAYDYEARCAWLDDDQLRRSDPSPSLAAVRAPRRRLEGPTGLVLRGPQGWNGGASSRWRRPQPVGSSAPSSEPKQGPLRVAAFSAPRRPWHMRRLRAGGSEPVADAPCSRRVAGWMRPADG